MVLRPDELANLSEIERDRRIRSKVKQGASAALTAAGGIGASGLGLGYGKIAEKLMPLLSEALPLNVAMEGIKKVSPKIGRFLERGQGMGLDIQEGMEFVKEQFNKKAENESQTIFQEIIADYPVESLDEEGQKQLRFLENVANQLEQKGKDITDPGFKKIKKKVSDLFKGKSGIMMQEMARSADMQQEIANQAEPMQPQQGQMVSGMGPGQKALMDILQRIQQRRGM